MIRLLTASLGGEGYLNFMGNEFGHPEWIDFPREGNGWSYHYCRRQWSLADDENLRYQYLNAFEKSMVKLVKPVLGGKERQLWLDNEKKTLVYQKGQLVFAHNLHPTDSYEGYWIPVPEDGEYRVVMSTDDLCFGGHGRVWHETYNAKDGAVVLYLPSRTAVVLKKI